MTSAVMHWSYRGYLSLSMVALLPTVPTSVMNLQPVFLPSELKLPHPQNLEMATSSL